MGLQDAQDLASVPLIGQAPADAPLQVSLIDNWPGGNTWRLLLLGPVLGLVVGGMVGIVALLANIVVLIAVSLVTRTSTVVHEAGRRASTNV